MWETNFIEVSYILHLSGKAPEKSIYYSTQKVKNAGRHFKRNHNTKFYLLLKSHSEGHLGYLLHKPMIAFVFVFIQNRKFVHNILTEINRLAVFRCVCVPSVVESRSRTVIECSRAGGSYMRTGIRNREGNMNPRDAHKNILNSCDYIARIIFILIGAYHM